MTPLRSHSRLVLKSDDVFLLTSSNSRKAIYFIVLAVFAAAMIAGFNPAEDLAGGRLFGTIGYAAVMLVLIGVIAWTKTTRFDRSAGRMQTTSTVFGITVSQDEGVPLDSIEAVILQKVQLLKSRDMPLRKSSAMSGLIEPRAQLFRLFLELPEDKIKIEESSYSEEIDKMASFISEFLGVSKKTEDL